MSQEFHCVLCSSTHVSEHKHKIMPKDYEVLRRRFPHLEARIVAKSRGGKGLGGRSYVYACCQWFKADHPQAIRDIAEHLVDAEPQVHRAITTGDRRQSMECDQRAKKRKVSQSSQTAKKQAKKAAKKGAARCLWRLRSSRQ